MSLSIRELKGTTGKGNYRNKVLYELEEIKRTINFFHRLNKISDFLDLIYINFNTMKENASEQEKITNRELLSNIQSDLGKIIDNNNDIRKIYNPSSEMVKDFQKVIDNKQNTINTLISTIRNLENQITGSQNTINLLNDRINVLSNLLISQLQLSVVLYELIKQKDILPNLIRDMNYELKFPNEIEYKDNNFYIKGRMNNKIPMTEFNEKFRLLLN